MSKYSKLTALPDPGSINSGLHPCPTQQLVSKFGPPRMRLTQDCMPVTSPFWRAAMRTESVGPFRATGHRLALDLFRQGFADVKSAKPDLYAVLGSAGMLCCRLVRNSRSQLSNHGLGMALDVTVDGQLDVRGDNLVQQGLLELYSVLKTHGIYWGAEFAKEDAMHFEISKEVIDKWIAEGQL